MSLVPPIVEVRHLTKAYTNVRAVNDVSLSIDACECFGSLGPNGAGKTTIIEVMEGILPATSGVFSNDCARHR